MQNMPADRLVSLFEAFERIGCTYVDGWTGEERAFATLGQRKQNALAVWERARTAISIVSRLARDGRLGIVAYVQEGQRLHYYEHSKEVLSALLFPPNSDRPGLIELHSGTTWECEADISKLRLRSAPRERAGRKPKYGRFEALIEEGLRQLGVAAKNADLKDFARRLAGSDLYPTARSTENDIIERVRRRCALVR